MWQMSATMHVICSARAVACIVHNTCLHWLQHLRALAITPLIYVCQNIYLRRLKTLVYVGQCCDLHQPQQLSFTLVTTSIYVGQNTCLCRPQHLSFTSAKTSLYVDAPTNDLPSGKHTKTHTQACDGVTDS